MSDKYLIIPLGERFHVVRADGEIVAECYDRARADFVADALRGTAEARRERIATAALAGMLATNETDTIDGYVSCAIAYADALIAALDAKP